MSAEIIEFTVNDRPADEFVRIDDEGRKMFYFMIHYRMGESQWSCRIWAYDAEDAQARLDGIKASGTVAGQVYVQI